MAAFQKFDAFVENVFALVASINAPKQVIRDQQGNIIGTAPMQPQAGMN